MMSTFPKKEYMTTDDFIKFNDGETRNIFRQHTDAPFRKYKLSRESAVERAYTRREQLTGGVWSLTDWGIYISLRCRDSSVEPRPRALSNKLGSMCFQGLADADLEDLLKTADSVEVLKDNDVLYGHVMSVIRQQAKALVDDADAVAGIDIYEKDEAGIYWGKMPVEDFNGNDYLLFPICMVDSNGRGDFGAGNNQVRVAVPHHHVVELEMGVEDPGYYDDGLSMEM